MCLIHIELFNLLRNLCSRWDSYSYLAYEWFIYLLRIVVRPRKDPRIPPLVKGDPKAQTQAEQCRSRFVLELYTKL